MSSKTKTCINGANCLNMWNGGTATQPVENFHRYGRAKDGRKSECKTDRLAYQRDYDSENSKLRTVKNKARNAFTTFDEIEIAYNYLANQLGVKTKVETYNKDRAFGAKIRSTVKKNFTTTAQKTAVFNLLSFQLGQTARA
jgi:hypothetical protein